MIGNKLTGGKILEGIARLETDCAAATMEAMPNLGAKAPQCYEALGIALGLLDGAASCVWGCAGGDHCLEYLIGCATSSVSSAMCLAKSGYYDQSLSSTRSLCETANLLALFDTDKVKLAEWKSVDEGTRKKMFSPVKVRLALEARNAPLPVTEGRYGRFSTLSIHASPLSKPQAHHNLIGQPFSFPVFQEAGFLLALNEIALPAAFIVLYAGKLLHMKDEIREVYRDVALAMGECLGGIMITEGRPWFTPDAKQYEPFARECLALAEEAKDEHLRLTFLELARRYGGTPQEKP